MVTILYKTDFQHSFHSRDLIGVFTSKAKLNQAVKRIIKTDLRENSNMKGTDLSGHIKWNIDFFNEKGQTQGLESFELASETIIPNIVV